MIDASFVTIVSYITGSKGHQYCRQLAQDNPDYYWPDYIEPSIHATNRINGKMYEKYQKFPAEFMGIHHEMFLNKVFQILWANGIHWNSEISYKIHQEYLKGLRKLVPEGLRVVLRTHSPPSQIRFMWPNCEIHSIHINSKEEKLESIDRFINGLCKISLPPRTRGHSRKIKRFFGIEFSEESPLISKELQAEGGFRYWDLMEFDNPDNIKLYVEDRLAQHKKYEAWEERMFTDVVVDYKDITWNKDTW